MFRFTPLLASVTLLISSVVFPLISNASPSPRVCANAAISIKAEGAVDHNDICGGADDALTFFSRLDLELLHPLVVEVVRNLPNFMSKTAVGCYLEEEQRILVLTFSAFQKRRHWFGVPVDRSMYRSLVTHEVAHAVGSCHFAMPDPPIQAQEYVAYVAMFSMMNPDLRERVLAENPGVGFDSQLEMNEIIYLFDPMRFGVEAYRHYLKNGQGTAFLRRVLSGKALISRGIELPNLRKRSSPSDAS